WSCLAETEERPRRRRDRRPRAHPRTWAAGREHLRRSLVRAPGLPHTTPSPAPLPMVEEGMRVDPCDPRRLFVFGLTLALGIGKVVQFALAHGFIHIPGCAFEFLDLGIAAFGREGGAGGFLLSLGFGGHGRPPVVSAGSRACRKFYARHATLVRAWGGLPMPASCFVSISASSGRQWACCLPDNRIE